MIYLTGDTHGSIDIQKIFDFADRMDYEGKELSKDDYLIVLGDFGLIWHDKMQCPLKFRQEEYLLDLLDELPFTTLFIDGNHENHVRLNSYPVSFWKGGKVSFIRKSVIHLKRGQIFDLDGKKFFTTGGATSIDKAFRHRGISYWEEENISAEDLDEAFANLAKVSNSVDYVLTHAAPVDFARELVEKQYFKYGADINEMHLRDIQSAIRFTKWYCGHYHLDYENGKCKCLYNEIVALDENGET